jgi:hypothetical protein
MASVYSSVTSSAVTKPVIGVFDLAANVTEGSLVLTWAKLDRLTHRYE